MSASPLALVQEQLERLTKERDEARAEATHWRRVANARAVHITEEDRAADLSLDTMRALVLEGSKQKALAKYAILVDPRTTLLKDPEWCHIHTPPPTGERVPIPIDKALRAVNKGDVARRDKELAFWNKLWKQNNLIARMAFLSTHEHARFDHPEQKPTATQISALHYLFVLQPDGIAPQLYALQRLWLDIAMLNLQQYTTWLKTQFSYSQSNWTFNAVAATPVRFSLAAMETKPPLPLLAKYMV